MNGDRITSFDYIRVVSILGILICHSFLDSWFYTEWLGRFMGMTFNFLFLVLSAFLFGISWENKNFEKYSIDFVSRRLRKLSRSYYPYLVLLFFFLYITQNFFSLKKTLTHTLFLPWFDRISGFGHLWFITMIVICYVGCVVFTRIPHNKLNLTSSCCLFASSIVVGYLSMIVGIPGYIFPYLIAYLLVFKYARKILAIIRKISLQLNILQISIFTGINIIFFYYYKLNPYDYYAYLLGIIQAISTFCFLYNICINIKESKIVLFISSISFEVYLVHEFFLGKLSVYKFINNPLLSFVVFIALSITAGVILKYIAKKIPI